MSKLGNRIREKIPSNGRLAKTLTVLYAVWLIIVINIAVNTYSHTNHHPVAWGLFIVSVIGSFIPALISVLYEGEYAVFILGSTKASKKQLAKMDERQLQARRQIFERSYAILATLTFLGAFIGSSWFGNNMSQNGVFLIGYNLFIFVISLPSLVAVWDKSPVTHTIE
jgi:uncharacterized membrane protein YfcA